MRVIPQERLFALCNVFNSSQLRSFRFNKLHTFPVRLDYGVWLSFYICSSIVPAV